MTTASITDLSGKEAGTVELPAQIFDAQANIPLMHQVVVAQLAAARQGTHKAKTRGEVSGGGKKPYRQKGTGRARQGSTRAPQFAGGGTSHGPVPHDYVQRTPKKMKAAALRGALSDRARAGKLHVLSSLVEGDTPSTKKALGALAYVAGGSKNVLVVVTREDELGWKSLRNAPQVHLIANDQLNTYDVLNSDDVVFTKAALDAFLAASGVVADSVADAPKALVDTTKAAAAKDFGPDSHPANEDGSQPEGFDIKGNADSMLYHVPGTRFYNSTVAEVWFRTAEAAEAAGFQLPPSQRQDSKEAEDTK